MNGRKIERSRTYRGVRNEREEECGEVKLEDSGTVYQRSVSSWFYLTC